MSDRSFQDALAAYRRRMNDEERALSARLGRPLPEEQPAQTGVGDYGGGQREPPGIGPTYEPPSMNELLRAALRGRRSQ